MIFSHHEKNKRSGRKEAITPESSLAPSHGYLQRHINSSTHTHAEGPINTPLLIIKTLQRVPWSHRSTNGSLYPYNVC